MNPAPRTSKEEWEEWPGKWIVRADLARELETQLTEMTMRAMKAEAAIAKANATIEDFFTGGRLTCDQCLEAMPCNCGHSLRRP
jgi:hypothetical protein